jgi:hypothetical protein
MANNEQKQDRFPGMQNGRIEDDNMNLHEDIFLER